MASASMASPARPGRVVRRPVTATQNPSRTLVRTSSAARFSAHQDYTVTHNVSELFTNALDSLLRQQPAQPASFLALHFSRYLPSAWFADPAADAAAASAAKATDERSVSKEHAAWHASLLDLVPAEEWPGKWTPPRLPSFETLCVKRTGPDFKVAEEKIRGPTKWSSWIIPDRVLAGAMPLNKSARDDLASAGVTLIIELNHPWERTELERQAAMCLRKAITAVKVTLTAKKPAGSCAEAEESSASHVLPNAVAGGPAAHVKSPPISRESHPIDDRGVLPDKAATLLALKMVRHVQAGEVLYIHCTNGGGRTGLITCLLLGLAYDLDGAHALSVYQALHDMRLERTALPPHGYEPTADTSDRAASCVVLNIKQREQVIRLLHRRNWSKELETAQAELKTRFAEIGKLQQRLAEAENKSGIKKYLPLTVEQQSALDAATAKVKQEKEAKECTFSFLTRDVILQSNWKSLPSHTDLKKDGKLLQKTIRLLEVCIGEHANEICSVSHRWETFDQPDLSGAQFEAIKAHVEANEEIKLIWYDYSCLPQGQRTDAENTLFRWGLENANFLYLGCSVLLLVDLSYISRFWTQFEAWMAHQRCTSAGLRPALLPEHERSTVVTIHQAGEINKKQLIGMWGRATPEEAIELLQKPDVTVTNQGDKKLQLQKIQGLNDDVKDTLNTECLLEYTRNNVELSKLFAFGFEMDVLEKYYSISELKEHAVAIKNKNLVALDELYIAGINGNVEKQIRADAEAEKRRLAEERARVQQERMSSAAYSCGGCFHGDGAVLLSDGISTKPARELRPGDLVATSASGGKRATATVVARTFEHPAEGIPAVRVGSLLITAGHPICLNGKSWIRPVSLLGHEFKRPTTRDSCAELYNFVTEPPAPMIVDGVLVSTLGMHSPGVDDGADASSTTSFYGSWRCIRALQAHPQWPDIDLTENVESRPQKSRWVALHVD